MLDGAPLLLVDLDSADQTPLPPLPELLACVVVGIGAAATERDLAGLDVVLTESAAPGAVVTADPEAGAAQLQRSIDASSHAATVLCQILRAGEGVDPAAALLYESLAFSTLQSGAVFRSWLATRRPAKPDPPVPDEQLVVATRVGDELHLVLNRPERHNALGSRLRDALDGALDLAALDDSLTAVHLRGEGLHFSSGGDLNEFGTATDGGLAHLVRVTRSPGLRIGALGDKVTAHVHGACIGAGIELPAFAGHVLASRDARFRLPEVAMGLIPGAGGTVSIPRRIGRHRTAWLAITGQEIDVSTALGWGLVDEPEPDR